MPCNAPTFHPGVTRDRGEQDIKKKGIGLKAGMSALHPLRLFDMLERQGPVSESTYHSSEWQTCALEYAAKALEKSSEHHGHCLGTS